MLYPVELRAHPSSRLSRKLRACRRDEASARVGRGRGIRTPDTLLPKQVRYQTALYPAAPDPPVARTARRKGPKCYEPLTLASIERTSTTRAETRAAARKKGAFAPSFPPELARPERFELPTTKFVAWYSIQLSYGRVEPSIIQQDAAEAAAARRAGIIRITRPAVNRF